MNRLYTWRFWLFASICFIILGVMNMYGKNTMTGLLFGFLGIFYGSLSRTYYKRQKNAKKK